MMIREEDSTDNSFGKPPSERSVEEHLELGIINLDKPRGPTSHQVADWVKKILSAKKCGHSGTLDPAVSGVLPTAVDGATKILRAILKSPKEYVGVMHLHGEVDDAAISNTVKRFTGEIMQKPPVHSAVKRVERKRSVYDFEIIERESRDVLFRTSVQAGTYIRKLCDDMGRDLRVGAHMAELRRVRAGPFSEKTIVSLHDLKDAYELWKEGGRI